MALLETKFTPEDLPGFFVAVILVIAVLAALRYVVIERLPERGGYRGQLALFFVYVFGILVVMVALPLETGTRDQVFSLVGIVLSAAVALSSTTFLGNLIAGGMLRTVRHFELGDWIRVEGHFGRVTERGLLHTEIQTEDRDLTTIPNLTLATHPVKVVRSSGTIISAKVGLGFDVPHAKVEASLLKAAHKIGLEDAFVSVLELGDYAVTYRVAGKLVEVDRLISRRSRLRRAMLDALHGDGIEIMSPAFMNIGQRDPLATVIPDEVLVSKVPQVVPEEVAFDKADVAKGVELKRAATLELKARIAELESKMGGAEPDAKEAMEHERARMKEELARLGREIESGEVSLKDPSA